MAPTVCTALSAAETDETAHRHTLSVEHARLLEERRGLPAELCARLGIASQSSNLTFAFLSQSGSLLFHKHRGPKKNFWIEPKGVKLRLWNLPAHACLSGAGGTLIITEGEFDAAACVHAGFPCAMSVPNGAPARPGEGEIDPNKDKQFAYLWGDHGLYPELAEPKRIILFTDDDEPGHVLRDELAIRLGADRCFAVAFPDGCKDANEILIKYGVETLKNVLENPFPLIPNRLTTLSSIPISAHRERYYPGWRTLEPHLILCPPELVTVTGRPGAGKSQFTLNWMLNISRDYNVGGAIIQFEDDIERTRKDVLNYQSRWFPKDPHWADRLIRVIPPSVAEDDTRDLEWLQQAIWEAACRHGAKWVIIDPWNEVEHMWDRNKNETLYINDALRDLKRMARRYNIAIVIVAHPDKSGGRHESIDDMTLYSIAGGAAWKNKSDHGLVIDLEKDTSGVTGNTIVKVDKSKNHTIMGVPGMATLRFDVGSRLYVSI